MDEPAHVRGGARTGREHHVGRLVARPRPEPVEGVGHVGDDVGLPEDDDVAVDEEAHRLRPGRVRLQRDAPVLGDAERRGGYAGVRRAQVGGRRLRLDAVRERRGRVCEPVGPRATERHADRGLARGRLNHGRALLRRTRSDRDAEVVEPPGERRRVCE